MTTQLSQFYTSQTRLAIFEGDLGRFKKFDPNSCTQKFILCDEDTLSPVEYAICIGKIKVISQIFQLSLDNEVNSEMCRQMSNAFRNYDALDLYNKFIKGNLEQEKPPIATKSETSAAQASVYQQARNLPLPEPTDLESTDDREGAFSSSTVRLPTPSPTPTETSNTSSSLTDDREGPSSPSTIRLPTPSPTLSEASNTSSSLTDDREGPSSSSTVRLPTPSPTPTETSNTSSSLTDDREGPSSPSTIRLPSPSPTPTEASNTSSSLTDDREDASSSSTVRLPTPPPTLSKVSNTSSLLKTSSGTEPILHPKEKPVLLSIQPMLLNHSRKQTPPSPSKPKDKYEELYTYENLSFEDISKYYRHKFKTSKSTQNTSLSVEIFIDVLDFLYLPICRKGISNEQLIQISEIIQPCVAKSNLNQKEFAIFLQNFTNMKKDQNSLFEFHQQHLELSISLFYKNHLSVQKLKIIIKKLFDLQSKISLSPIQIDTIKKTVSKPIYTTIELYELLDPLEKLCLTASPPKKGCCIIL